MSTPHSLYIAGATNNLETALSITARLGGTAYIDARSAYDHLPFRALVTVTTDDLEDLESCSERGLYVICQRVIKPGNAKVFGLFPMVHHPDMTHVESDSHWRDKHAPLALEHHPHMTQYLQLSVIHTISGQPYDGFAMCGFETEDDLRNRFYISQEGVDIIAKDVSTFADLKKSPTRLIATPAP
ncbi:MAG: EthD domain-containing protein [Pseudomonadota bacterium]